MSLIDHNSRPNDVISTSGTSKEVIITTDCGIIRPHGVLRHLVPPAPVVPPRVAGYFRNPSSDVVHLPISNKPPSLDLQGQRHIFPFPALLRKRVS